MADDEIGESKREALARELEAVRVLARDGVLHAKNVVQWARNHRKSALYGTFEWNDKEAGEAYRLAQAQTLIRLVVVQSDATPRPVRAYLSLPSDRVKGGGYRTVDDALLRARQELVAEAVKELLSFKTRFSYLPELLPLFASLEATAEQFLAARLAPTG